MNDQTAELPGSIVEIEIDLHRMLDAAHDYLKDIGDSPDNDNMKYLNELLTDLQFSTYTLMTAARLFKLYTIPNADPSNGSDW